MLLKAIYVQIIVLLLTAVWIAASKRRSQFDSVLKVFAIIVLFLGLWLGGVWVYPPLYGLLIGALALVVLMGMHFRKGITKTAMWRNIVSNIPLLALLPLGGFLLWQGITGRLTPRGDYIALESPFKNEDGICVLSGGISPLLNFHIFPSTDSRDIAQTYGLDIIKTRPNGFRTTKGYTFDPKPKEPEQYAMFGVGIYAPCEGKVVEYENGLPDQTIGGSDKTNTGGNGVVLQCGKYHVHMHHLKQGSVLPRMEDEVKVGQKIGEIGNSGNTIEPHLHLHAETVVETGNTNVHGKPVHMQFSGRFMARGDCF